jgi:hypothetical protein
MLLVVRELKVKGNDIKVFVTKEKSVSSTLNVNFYNAERMFEDKHHFPTS